jgi:CheY-like chemotaxis protein
MDKIRAGLEIIRETGMRGAALVQQLLTLSRNGNLSFETIDIRDQVEKFAKILAETFPKTITVSVELEAVVPPVVADPNRLHQALLNLCVNARDAMKGSGHLTLKNGLISGNELRKRFADAQDQSYVCIKVSDTGEGIDHAVRERIFDPFFTTKGPGEGTGLGLTAVYGIVREHDGFVEVESEPGQGTTFTIYLPIRHANGKFPGKPEAEKPAPETGPVHGTVLLVDDEERQLDLIQGLLKKIGYRVLTAKDGIEAVEIHGRHKDEIAVVVLDLGLPKLGGWEAFLRMKQAQPGVRTIVTSGYIKADLRSEMIREGVAAIIHKPYMPDDLAAKIGAAISQQAAYQVL